MPQNKTDDEKILELIEDLDRDHCMECYGFCAKCHVFEIQEELKTRTSEAVIIDEEGVWCPRCDSRLDMDKPKHCKECGQKLDWSEVTVDVDYEGVCQQIKWERDLAIDQLLDLGYSLGEKPHICENCCHVDLCQYHKAYKMDFCSHFQWED